MDNCHIETFSSCATYHRQGVGTYHISVLTPRTPDLERIKYHISDPFHMDPLGQEKTRAAELMHTSPKAQSNKNREVMHKHKADMWIF